MTEERTWQGVYVAPITPMRDDLSVDLDALADHVDWMIDNGIHGITACAVTAEVETLTLAEHRDVLRVCVQAAAGRVPVLCGVGRPALPELMELVGYSQEIGGDGLFVITPYASAHTASEVVAHDTAVAAATTLPVMIYNCPPYAGVNLAPEHLAELAAVPNILAVKEGNQLQLHDSVLAVPDDFGVFTARDSYLLPSMHVGAAGVVSFVANVAPRQVVDLYGSARQATSQEQRDRHATVARLTSALVSRSYPVMIKAAVELRRPGAGPARRAAPGVTAEELRRLRAVVAEVEPSLAPPA